MADVCESQELAYWIVGSMASMAYGEPRFTNDIVIQLSPQQVAAFCSAFPSPDFYCPESTARTAVLQKFQGNILHSASGLKVDVIIPSDEDFSRSEATRRRRIASEGTFAAWFASPEDVILKKLVYYQLGGGVSDKHIRDIAGMMKLQGVKLDMAYIQAWAGRLRIANEWEFIRTKVELDPTKSSDSV
ncbi:MAG: hypothetical protein U0744_19805 [Gemmataceae bacterium]